MFDVVTRGAGSRDSMRRRRGGGEDASCAGLKWTMRRASYIREQGFGEYFFHRTGHSIGEEIHGTGANMDNLETHDERKRDSVDLFFDRAGNLSAGVRRAQRGECFRG